MLIRMKAAPGSSMVSFDGVRYLVEQGFVMLPNAAAKVMRAHGYEEAPEQKNPRGRPRKVNDATAHHD